MVAVVELEDNYLLRLRLRCAALRVAELSEAGRAV